jgi:two-component system, OmpR family, sensor histidine kinase BaeS
VSESLRLLALLAPVTVATVLSSVAARTLVRRAPLSYTLVAIAVVASSVTVVDMVLLNHFMLLNPDHWAEITLVALYSLTAAVAAALIVGRTTDDAIRRLAATAQSLGNNDLEVRTGSLNASPELQLLGATLDRAAERLEFAIDTERRIEGQRRDLMTSISHDLRTPLASIRATVEAINDGVVDDPQTVRRYAAEMLRSISALVDLVDDLYELSQLDARSVAADSRRLPFGEAIQRAADLCAHDATLRDVRVEVAVRDAGSATCSPKLIRVVQSLIDNAVRYTPRGGRVRVYAGADPASLRVSVEDTGRGIDPAQLHRVFEPFWRADEARSTRGSGLGLALAQRIVEALGGRIEATSTPEVGSRFVVVLPS